MTTTLPARSTSHRAVSGRFRVMLLVDPADPFARGCMGGIAKWVAQQPDWDVVVADFAAEAAGRNHRRPIADGAISLVPPATLRRQWRRGPQPVVFVSEFPDATTAPSIATDDDAAIRLAVEHLLTSRVRHVGYVPAERRCDQRRLAVARNVVAENEAALHVFEPPLTGHRLEEWLSGLPTPAGIVTGSDRRGLQVLQACRDAGLRVPNDIAVVGIGNDDCLCDLAVPGLTSVAHNLAVIGFEACRLLADLRKGGRMVRSLVLPPAGVVTRLSSDALAIDDPVVRRAIKAIRCFAGDGLTPDAIAEKIGLPRRTLERQFRRQIGRSIQEEVLIAKLDRARKLLAETDLKLLAIAVRSGFRDASQLCHSFKSAFGGSPMDYRRQVRPWDTARPA
ncbi:MAG: substrate-binding domain-containing protein [Planctomycetia bacterium]|nr:substrate-binding domain-containing protein [Planctomycetia bacterium]